MERAGKIRTDDPTRALANGRGASSPDVSPRVDNRPGAVTRPALAETITSGPRAAAQRALVEGIHNSPRLVAQRNRIASWFAGTATVQRAPAVTQRDEVAPRKLLQAVQGKAVAPQDRNVTPSVVNQGAPVIQRKILIGNTRHTHYDEQLITTIVNLVKPYIRQWGEMDRIFQKSSRGATATAKTNYLDQDGEDVNALANDVRSMLRKYNEVKSFANNQDLARQVVQDVKLRLLGMENVIGVDHQDGQFSETADDANVGRTGKTKTLHIYRTMSAANWNNYVQSKDLGDILYGHGGSLGQAMHYFAMSKRDAKDDVLVEFKFSNTAQNLMDYTQIKRGGEGGAPKNDKLTGKSEQNDIMGLDQSIFSVNLHKSKDLIKQLNPEVKVIDRAT